LRDTVFPGVLYSNIKSNLTSGAEYADQVSSNMFATEINHVGVNGQFKTLGLPKLKISHYRPIVRI
jgi:hypothetical protein